MASRLAIFVFAALLCGSANSADIFYHQNKTQWGSSPSIYVHGKIELGDDVKFAAVLDEIEKRGEYVGHVELNSPGGAVMPALAIGRMIRAMQFYTGAPIHEKHYNGMRNCPLGGTRIVTVNMRANPLSTVCTCVSACALIWFGGIGRGGGIVGLHRPFMTPAEFAKLSIEDAQSSYQFIQRNVLAYLKDMRVPDVYISRVFNAPSNDMDYLDENDFKILRGGDPAVEEYESAKCPPISSTELSYMTLNPKTSKGRELAIRFKRWMECTENVRSHIYRKALKDFKEKSR